MVIFQFLLSTQHYGSRCKAHDISNRKHSLYTIKARSSSLCVYFLVLSHMVRLVRETSESNCESVTTMDYFGSNTMAVSLLYPPLRIAINSSISHSHLSVAISVEDRGLTGVPRSGVILRYLKACAE